MLNVHFILVLLVGLLVSSGVNATDANSPLALVAQRYNRITGLDGRPSDIQALLKQSLGNDGNLDEDKLFAKLFADPAFINVRLATFASVLSNEGAEPFEDVDDFQTSVVLAINKDIDFRNLLTKPFFIENMNAPGTPTVPTAHAYGIGLTIPDFAAVPLNFSLNFSQNSGRPADGYYVEGLLTTNGFAVRSIKDGTNRRAIRAIYDQFLCTKIDTWKDASLDDFYVGRDVDRKPGDNPETYQTTCRACHAPMDAQRGALAFYDYDKNMNQLTIESDVVKKYLQNATVFPEGEYVTTDARWEILLTDPASQQRFGWRGGPKAMTGKGLLSFSSTIANAHQFQTCMAQRLVSTFCERTDLREILQDPDFKSLVEQFHNDGYKMKTLIRKIVSSSLCQN